MKTHIPNNGGTRHICDLLLGYYSNLCDMWLSYLYVNMDVQKLMYYFLYGFLVICKCAVIFSVICDQIHYYFPAIVNQYRGSASSHLEAMTEEWNGLQLGHFMRPPHIDRGSLLLVYCCRWSDMVRCKDHHGDGGHTRLSLGLKRTTPY